MMNLLDIIEEIEACDARIKCLKERIERKNKDFDTLKMELKENEQYRSQWIDFIELNELIKLSVGDLLNELCSLTNVDPKKAYLSTSNEIRYYCGIKKCPNKRDILYNVAKKHHGPINNTEYFTVLLKDSKAGEKFCFEIKRLIDFGARLSDETRFVDGMIARLEYDDDEKMYYQSINLKKKHIKNVIVTFNYDELLKDETGLLKEAILNYFRKQENLAIKTRK